MADETLEMSNNALYEEVQRLRSEVISLRNAVANHTHSYAAAKRPSGGATALDANEETGDELAVVGLTTDGMHKLAVNPDVVIDGDEVRAGTFVGDLHGTADAAMRLDQQFTLKLRGSLDGDAVFDGSAPVEADVAIAASGVIEGEYGPIGNVDLAIGDTFTVPQFSVSSDGRVVWATNKRITVPANTGVAGTTDAMQFPGVSDPEQKLYVIGAGAQAKSVRTFSDKGCYLYMGHLHADGHRVVDEESVQNISNKTYEGFKLGAACARGVDEEVQGTAGSDALVTSNALALHKHLYARSKSMGGAASAIDTTVLDNISGRLVVDTGDGSPVASDALCVEDNKLVAHTLVAEHTMRIPGGRIWVDTSARVVDVSEYNSGAQQLSAAQVITQEEDEEGYRYSVQESLDRLNTRIVLLEQNYTSFSDIMDGMRGDLDAQVGVVSGVRNDMDSVLADNVAIRSEFADLSNEFSTLGIAVGQLNVHVNSLDGMRSDISALDSRITTLETRVDNIDTQLLPLPKLRGDVAQLMASYNAISSTVANVNEQLLEFRIAADRVASLMTRVSGLEESISGGAKVQFSLNPSGIYEYDLRRVFGDDAEAIGHSVTVLVRDNEATSRTKGMYVEATAITSVGYFGYTVTVANESDMQLSCLMVIR